MNQSHKISDRIMNHFRFHHKKLIDRPLSVKVGLDFSILRE